MAKKYDGVFFRSDGTLLPMDNDMFVKAYFKLLSKEVAPLGYEEEGFMRAMKKGVAAMVTNDGSCTNYHAFWRAFASVMGEDVWDNIGHFDNFYTGNFKKASAYTNKNPLAKRAILAAREVGERVVLATNPVFPMIGVEERLSWIGLKPDDFDYITCYTNSSYCKPSKEYYIDLAKKMECLPENCLMVGNNTKEDIEAATLVGMDTFLITDCIIVEGEMPKCKMGSFAQMVDFLEG